MTQAPVAGAIDIILQDYRLRQCYSSSKAELLQDRMKHGDRKGRLYTKTCKRRSMKHGDRKGRHYYIRKRVKGVVS